MRRASRSAAPPGGKATTRRTAWVGQFGAAGACASDGDIRLAATASAITKTLISVSLGAAKAIGSISLSSNRSPRKEALPDNLDKVARQPSSLRRLLTFAAEENA